MERFRYLIAIALFTPSITIAASFPDFPSNSILQDTSGGRSAIEVGCEPTDRSSPTVKCRFYQFTVSYELNPEDYQIKLNEEIAKIESGKYFDAIDPVTAMRELCKQMNTVEVKAGIAEKYKTQPKSVPRFKKYLTLLNKGCEVKNVGEAKLLAIEMAQFTLKEQTKTCKVWPNIWEESFQSRLTW